MLLCLGLLSNMYGMNTVGRWPLGREGGQAERPKSIINQRGVLQAADLVTFEHNPFNSCHRCNCLYRALQNDLLEGKVNLPHNTWNHSLTRARRTSASDVADLQPYCLCFQSSHVHAGQQKNVDNTLLINGASALEAQGKTQWLWNESRSVKLITHWSICDDKSFKVKQQTARLQTS